MLNHSPMPVAALVGWMVFLSPSLRSSPQESSPIARVSTVGRIVGSAGKSWVGARIVLLSRLHPICAEESVDRVEVTSDERGRFRAMLERDRVYVAWGFALAKGGDGAVRLSGLATDVLPGQPLRLEESKGRPACKIRLQDLRGVDPAKSRLSVVLSSLRPGYGRVDRSDVREGMGFAFPLPLDAKSRATIPPLPWQDLWLEIQDERGVRIQVEHLRALAGWKGEERTIVVSAVPSTSVRAKPLTGLGDIQGLTLYQRIRGRLRRIAQTESGDTISLGLRIPERSMRMSRAEPEYPDLELGAKGSARSLLLKVTDGLGKAGKSEAPWEMPLIPERILRGKMRTSRTLILRQDPSGRPGAFMATMADFPVYELCGGVDGSFVFGGLGPGGYWLSTPLTTKERNALRGEASVEPLALLSIGNLQADRDLGSLDPARLVRVDVSARFSDGTKARGVRILLLQKRRASAVYSVILRSITDRTGRRRLLLPPGGQYELLLSSLRGSSALSLDLRDARPAALRPVELTIPVGPWVRGQVVDANGDPCAGYRLYWVGRDGLGRAGVLAQRFAPDHSSLRTDAEGRFSFVAPLGKGKLLLFVDPERKRPTTLERLTLDGEDIEGLEVVVPLR